MDFEIARQQMLSQQIRTWDVLDERVLETLREIPREGFVPASERDLAFADIEIPLGHGQRMLSPKVEARLLQELAIEPTDRALEIGTGSGYLAACLAKLAESVTTVEFFPDLGEAADENLRRHGLTDVDIRIEDAMQSGFGAEFDVIAVTASAPTLPQHFIDMLRPAGRLFIVVGRAPAMEATLIQRHADRSWTRKSLFETVLPPLINVDESEAFVL